MQARRYDSIPTEVLFEDKITVNVTGMITGRVLENSLPEEQDHPIDLAKAQATERIGDLNMSVGQMELGNRGFKGSSIAGGRQASFLQVLDTEGDRENDQVRVSVNLDVRLRWASSEELNSELKADVAQQVTAQAGIIALEALENAELPFTWSIEDSFLGVISDGA